MRALFYFSPLILPAMKRKPYHKYLVLFILLFILVPGLLLYLLGENSPIALLMYFQLLLIWAQAEISLRQGALFSTQFEPRFAVELEAMETVGGPSGYWLKIENLSDTPAYDVGLARILVDHRPVPPELWVKQISNRRRIPVLRPLKAESDGRIKTKMENRICFIPKRFAEELFSQKATLEILYRNALGDFRSLWVTLSEAGEILIIQHGVERLGILLNMFEVIALLLRRPRATEKAA